MLNINKEFNPGSVGRLGADLIHASLFKFFIFKFNGAKVITIKKPTLLFKKS